jgi:nitroreductase
MAHLLRTRRSGGRVTQESPTDEEIGDLLSLAMNAPDHGAMRPWRMALLRGDARHRLGAALAGAQGAAGEERERAMAKPMRAPLLIGVVLCPRPNPKVPEWEQLAAAVAVVTQFGLLCHDTGWSSMWRSGPLVDTPEVRTVMGVADDERLLGWLYVGRPDPNASRPERPLGDARAHLSVIAADAFAAVAS